MEGSDDEEEREEQDNDDGTTEFFGEEVGEQEQRLDQARQEETAPEQPFQGEEQIGHVSVSEKGMQEQDCVVGSEVSQGRSRTAVASLSEKLLS